jgi:hypothetical protein
MMKYQLGDNKPAMRINCLLFLAKSQAGFLTTRDQSNTTLPTTWLPNWKSDRLVCRYYFHTPKERVVLEFTRNPNASASWSC